MSEEVMEDTQVCGTCLRRKPESEFAEGCDSCLKCKPEGATPRKLRSVVKLPDTMPTPTVDNSSGLKSQREADADGNVVSQMCKRCHEWLPISQFGIDPSDRTNDMIHRVCLCCIPDHMGEKIQESKKQRAKRRDPEFRKKRVRRRNKPKPKPRGVQWQRLCGVSQDQGFWLLKQQHYRCAICSKKFPQRKWNQKQGKSDIPQLDHKHGSTIVRGFLCLKCNTGLGLFRDNPDFLRLAANYLERTPPVIPANPQEKCH